MGVRFYDTVEDSLLKFAVIIAQSEGKWVYCKHKERDTYEIPGGHREAGERIRDTARRELMEETGAEDFVIEPVCAYSVTGKNQVNDSGEEVFGMLYQAEIKRFGKIDSEMERVELFDEMPDKLTYPEIQPKLLEEYRKRDCNNHAKKRFAELGMSKNMVLSTSYHDRVTSRMMSVIILNGAFYFQTDRTFRKAEQITHNPRVSLCADNFSVEGTVTQLGKPTEHTAFTEAFKKYFSGSYQRYSNLPNERLFEVKPTAIQRWVYEDSTPYIERFDFEKHEYSKVLYGS